MTPHNTNSESETAALGLELTAESKNVRVRLLSAMRREIEAVVMPDLNAAYAKLAASWVCQTIDYLLLDECDDLNVVAARDELLAKLRVSLKGAAYLPDLRDPHRAIDEIAAAVRESGTATARDTLHAVGAVAERAFTEESRFIEQRRTAELARMSRIETDVTADRLDRYFDSTKEFSGCRSRQITRMVGGYSRDTFLVEALTPADSVVEFAIRRDLPFGPVETSAADEFSFLERLRDLGIPVARPRAAVRDRSFLGEPFLLTDRVKGVPAEQPMGDDRGVGEAGAREMAHILARLHSINPQEVGLSLASGDPRVQIASTVAYWRARWDRFRCLESDVMEASFAWLDGNVPRNIPRSVIVHGDYRPGNALMDQGRITAMLDWEFIHAGDAAEDVEYMKLYVAPFLDPAAFTAEYLAAGGVEFQPASADFYEVFRSVRNVVCVDTSWYGFLTGLYPSMRLSWQGTTARRMILNQLAAALIRVTKP